MWGQITVWVSEPRAQVWLNVTVPGNTGARACLPAYLQNTKYEGFVPQRRGPAALTLWCGDVFGDIGTAFRGLAYIQKDPNVFWEGGAETPSAL